MIQRKGDYCPDPVEVLGFIDGLMNEDDRTTVILVA